MLRLILVKIINLLSPLFLLVAFPFALMVRLTSKIDTKKPQLVWGPVPIINNSYWSKAMKEAGFNSETYTVNFFPIINKREDWNNILTEQWAFLPISIKIPIAFLISLIKYDVFFIPFSGYFLGKSKLWRFEAYLLKLAGKKTVVIPYGADVYAYSKIRSTSLNHAILMSYPEKAKEEDNITNKVKYWRKHADVIIPGWVFADGIGRWDIFSPSQLHIDTKLWEPRKRYSNADGIKKAVTIAHAPNHRGFKGTEFIIQAIENLKKSGVKINFILIEKKQNSEVRDILTKQADILIEQLIFTGHGLNGLEGMAAGTVVISNLEDKNYTLPLRRWSFLNECPIVSATPENLEEILKILITNPDLRKQLGKAGVEYVDKYHDYEAAQYMFGKVIDFLYGREDSLINMYHPILDEYHKKLPKVKHPLINNKIPEKWQSKL